MKVFLIFFSIISLAKSIFSQEPTYYFKNYQANTGLSSNTITAITQDNKGFMWFGSRNGLNRFDGTSFKVFRSNPLDITSIGSNSILSLYEDEKENLWVGTYKGLYIYDPLKETFSSFKAIPAGEVRFIIADKYHNIWIIANATLYQYDQRNARLKTYIFKNTNAIALHISEKGAVWVATSDGLLRKHHPQTNTFTAYDIPRLYGKSITLINAIHALGDTSLIIGTINDALLLNLKTLSVNRLFKGNKKIQNVHVHTIFKQTPEEFWLGTEAGLYIFNTRTKKTVIVAKELNNPYAITDNIVSSIYKDTEGGTWIGTYFGGINYYSKQFNNFHKYLPNIGENSLSGNLVHEICKDQYGKLWIGTEDAGLNQLDLKTGNIKSFLPDNSQGSIAYHNIHGLLADGDKLWIGTYEHGLDVMDLKTNKVIRHYDASGDNESFTSNFIITLYKTRNNDILVGTWNGLFKYNRQNDTFSLMPFFDGHIQNIYEDSDGTLWVATYGSGVYYHNARTNAKGQISHTADSKNGLINNYVNNLYKDSKKNFWFCTENGLSLYVPATKKITHFTVEDGLPDNQIFRILEDEKGKYWISTSKGLSELDLQNLTFTNYNAAHGLPTEQFNYNSAFKDTDGTLFFGTVKGLISFNPSDFIKNSFIPPVYITGLQLNNKETEINSPQSPIDKAIIYTSNITLPYDKSNLTLDVAALSYIIPEMNGYSYRLEGIDKDWVTLNNNRKIYYTNLSPGDYIFRVKGSNSEGVWNNKETQLAITILPPFWATFWAYLFYALAISGIIFIILRYYYLALHEKNKRKIEIVEINKEREIYNAKIEFFTNVAHEIRTPLTLIKMPLDKLINKEEYSSETNESLNMIKKNTNRLIDLTNQLLDFRKAEANNFSLNFSKTDINDLLNDIHLSFKPVAEQKNIRYDLTLPRLTLHAYVDPEALRKIISNLFNNAIKYAQQIVEIKLLPFNSDDTAFYIEFRNDGYLIPKEYKDKIFEPFFRVKETNKETGTGIGLPLARSLTELHKGTLVLQKAEENQNVFLLTLPIHQDAEINLKADDEDTLASLPEANDPADESLDATKPVLLIVEDNKEILCYLQKELTESYRIIKAYNGQEALEALLKENVQLVISDIMMPVMDGIKLCKKMKSDLQYSHIPIILLTAKNSLNAKIEGLEVGADAYIEKPFSFDHLLAQMTNLLNNRNIIKEYFARNPLTHIKGIASSKADTDFLEQLNQNIQNHIMDEELDVDRLSSLMNMSRPTLYRKIKGLSDLTPNELINLTRLKKGAELLAEGNYKINEVANLIGYSLATNFSRDFQKAIWVKSL